MKELRLGVIGISEGNGHPYSWSALFNGYNSEAMAQSGFPVISQYLSERKFPEDLISGACVTHIWTQNPLESQKIAAASLIPHIVEKLEDLIGQVDALLLARDDAENHFKIVRPFLEAGLPIYIDKPLALSLKEAQTLLEGQKYSGQNFSCSALQFAQELQLTAQDRKEIGPIQMIQGVTPKSWVKYGIHLIEPTLKIVGEDRNIIEKRHWIRHNKGIASVFWEGDLLTTFLAAGSVQAPISLLVMGEKGFKSLIFEDSFSAFKSALECFLQGVRDKKSLISENFMLKAIEILDQGD